MSTVKVRATGRQNNSSSKSTALLILAVAYYRMSTDKQDKSIAEQRDEVRKWAAANGYKIVREYVEPGISGDDTRKRKEFQRMMADAESGDFAAILSWDQDRFGRFDTVESGFWIHPLREAGVHLATCAQGAIDWNSFAGRLIYNVTQEGKHQFLRDLSRNTTRGLVAKAQRGEWVSGPIPLAYKVVNKRLALSDKSDVATVLKIFDLYDAAGLSIRGVRDAMNKRGRRPTSGRLWSESGIRKILSNPIYCGDFIWPKKSVGKYNTASQSLTGQIELRDNHPAIITREQFERVQTRLAANKTQTTPIVNGGKYLLSGLLYCKNCGSKMYGWTLKDRAYYKCSGFDQKGAALCDRNLVRQDEILDQVLESLESWAADPSNRGRVAAELAALVEDATSGDSVEVLTARLAAIDQKLARAEERLLIVDDDLFDTIQNMVRELRAERKEIEAGLKVARVPVKKLAAEKSEKVEAAIAAMSGLRQVVAASDPPRVREMLKEIIERIDVHVSKKETAGRFHYTLQSGEIRFINPLKLAHGSSEWSGYTGRGLLDRFAGHE